jgi:hypothetical protein
VGAYSEYLNLGLDFDGLQAERKKQLKIISALRGGRDILVYAADLTKNTPLIMMDYSDILPVQDQLANLSGNQLDVIVETPGGVAEAAEDIIRILRGRYERVGMIVPGWAKSAGTIFVMAGDEILMGATSALGPIDAQITSNAKRFSAHAFLEWLESVTKEVKETGKLNPALIPILQNISPGEIQHAHNAQKFSETLVTEWLEDYKFKYWEKRRTSGAAVTPKDKLNRAKDIARMLCSQSLWLTHGRSIRIEDLETKLNLQILDYRREEHAALNDAITRYYTLLRMTFETNMYKLIETPSSQIYRFTGVESVPGPKRIEDFTKAEVQLMCGKCRTPLTLQINFQPNVPLKPGCLPYPTSNNILKCPACGAENNVIAIRLQIEAQTRKKIV